MQFSRKAQGTGNPHLTTSYLMTANSPEPFMSGPAQQPQTNFSSCHRNRTYYTLCILLL